MFNMRNPIKNYLTIFILSITCIGTVAAQVSGQSGNDPNENLRALGNMSTSNTTGALTFDNRYEGVKGSPFLFPSWYKGSIHFAKKDTMSAPVDMNVNLITQTVNVRLKDGSIGEINAMYTKGLKVLDKEQGNYRSWVTLSEKDVEGKRSVRLKFYEALHSGTFSLLKSVGKSFVKADYSGAYAVGERYDEFVTEESYWLQTPGQPYQEVRLKRKYVERALEAYADQVKALSKEHKLNLGRTEDIVQLLEFLETAER